ncbi:unnamed protein product [Sphacelaria rigidula]
MATDDSMHAAVRRSPQFAQSNRDATSGDEPSPGSTNHGTPVAGGERLPSSAGGTRPRTRRQSAALGGDSSGMVAGVLLGAQRPMPATCAEEPRAGQADVQTPKKRKRATLLCGKAPCGSTEAWPTPCPVCPGSPVHSGDLLCCACHRRPPDARGAEPLFRHLANDAAVADAAEFWERMSAAGVAAQTAVVKGWVPSRGCLCPAPDCFYSVMRTEKRKEQRAAARCVACGRAPKTALNRAGEKYRLLEEFFRASDSTAKHPGGHSINLDADSRLCSACLWAFHKEGDNTLFKKGADGKWTVHQYLLHLDTSDAPGAGVVTAASHIATRDVVAEIAAGRLVDLDEAINIIRHARRREGLHDVGARALSNDAARILDRVASAVSGVRDLSFSGGDVHQDRRLKFRVLMPLVFDEWWIANIYASERELQREKKQREAALSCAAGEGGGVDAQEQREAGGGDGNTGVMR